MHASLRSVGVVGVALFVGCSQPITPTSPTSLSSASLPVASSQADGTAVGVLSHEQNVPFKGRLEGTATITPRTPPFVFVSIEGTGNEPDEVVAAYVDKVKERIAGLIERGRPARREGLTGLRRLLP